MPLNSETVKRLGSSKFNYWFGYVANGTWVLWLASRALPSGPAPLPAAQFALYAAAGLLLWTFLEYLLHRYVYHVIPSFLSQGHHLHHESPRALIGVPWWLTSAILYGIYRGLALAFHPGATGVVMAGTWFGYIGYCLLHHGSHHWAMRNSYLRRVKKLHQLHHVYPDTNWGFTTSFWDRLFRTYQPEATARSRSARPRQHVPPRQPTRATPHRAEAPPPRQHDASAPSA